MNKVTIIERMKLMTFASGETKGLILKWGCIVFLIMCCITIIGIIIAVPLYYLMFIGGDYKPEKSFWFHRLPKEKMRKYQFYFAAFGILFLLVDALANGFGISFFWYLVVILLTLYYVNKSFAFHEDVDYSVNMEVSELLGMEVDEKIQASYQNFDSSDKIKSGSNMMLVTDKKVIFAYNNGQKWEMVNKKINDIVKIGYTGYGDSENYMRLCFSDDTAIGLRMCMYDKFTSNPDLFFKKFLIVLDAVLLGKTDERIASRRRVSVNEDAQPSARTNDESVEIRKVDISSTILQDLKDATPVEPGRSLDL